MVVAFSTLLRTATAIGFALVETTLLLRRARRAISNAYAEKSFPRFSFERWN